MKVKELLENVVSFAQARAKREQQAAEHQKQQDVEQDYNRIQGEDERETLTVHELAEFEEYMNTAKKKGRVPGFDDMDDAVCFLLADIELPQHITRSTAINWFSKLSEEEREKARMLSFHADRMIQIFNILKTKLHGLQDTWAKRFNGKVPRGWDAIEGAAWLDSEFSYDLKCLKNLKKAVEIIGQ